MVAVTTHVVAPVDVRAPAEIEQPVVEVEYVTEPLVVPPVVVKLSEVPYVPDVEETESGA